MLYLHLVSKLVLRTPYQTFYSRNLVMKLAIGVRRQSAPAPSKPSVPFTVVIVHAFCLGARVRAFPALAAERLYFSAVL